MQESEETSCWYLLLNHNSEIYTSLLNIKTNETKSVEVYRTQHSTNLEFNRIDVTFDPSSNIQCQLCETLSILSWNVLAGRILEFYKMLSCVRVRLRLKGNKKDISQHRLAVKETTRLNQYKQYPKYWIRLDLNSLYTQTGLPSRINTS